MAIVWQEGVSHVTTQLSRAKTDAQHVEDELYYESESYAQHRAPRTHD